MIDRYITPKGYSYRITVSRWLTQPLWAIWLDGKCCMANVTDDEFYPELDALSELFGLARG